MTFKELLDAECFQQACDELGYSADWNTEMKIVVLEDAAGTYKFRAGLNAKKVLSLLSVPRILPDLLESVLVPAENENF